jgi:sugar phosphate isomerase/epimerase
LAPFTIARHVTDISSRERERIRTTAAQAGIGISGLHWVLAQTEGMYLTHPDPDIPVVVPARYFVDLVECCRELGGNRIIVGSPKQRNLLEGISHEEAWRFATETFRDAVRCAEGSRGDHLLRTACAPAETNIFKYGG